MNMMEMLQIQREESHLVIDARNAIRKGHHPRYEILTLVKEAPRGTLCEVHVPHQTAPLIVALEELGLNVAVSQVSPDDIRLRVMKI